MNVFDIISLAAAGGYLVPCAASDLRKKSIPVSLAVGGPACAGGWMLFRMIRADIDWTASVSAGMPGVLMMGLSLLTGGRVGLGDGLVLLGIGFLLGCRETFYILMISLLLASFWSAFLLVRKKAGKESRIPWIPFLLAGYAAAVIWNIFISRQ